MPYTDDTALPEVTESELMAALAKTRPYTIVVLKAGPRYSPPGPDRDPEIAATILRHGIRNMRLRLAGLLRVVCPVADGSDVAGIGVFDATPEECAAIYSADPAVAASILTYEIHPTRTFPESSLA